LPVEPELYSQNAMSSLRVDATATSGPGEIWSPLSIRGAPAARATASFSFSSVLASTTTARASESSMKWS